MGTPRPYVHLHRHDQHSLYDGFGTAQRAAEWAARHEVPAIGLTNHGNVSGLIDHYYACKKVSVKPVLGLETYIVGRWPARDPKTGKGRRKFHLTLLAKNLVGYKNLMKLQDLSSQEKAFYYKPTLSINALLEHADGLWCLTGCPAGPIAKLLMRKGQREAAVLVHRLKEAFDDRLYAEVQSNGYDEKLNQEIVRLARSCGLSLALTHDSHFISRKDGETYSSLMRLHRGDDYRDEGRANLWMPSAREAWPMTKGLTGLEFAEGIVGSAQIADQTSLELESVKPAMPVIENADSWLEARVRKGLMNKDLWDDSKVVYRVRVEQELEIIKQIGMSSYFCVVADIIKWARKSGIRTGAGRGSVGGSLVAYALGITQVDPVRFGIGFERFLRPDKKTPPDIDLDFDAALHERVIAHAIEEYDAKPIATFGYYRHKNLVNDLCKIYGEENRGSLDSCEKIEDDSILDSIARKAPEPKAVDAYKRTINSIRYAGSHPGGVAIIEPKDAWMVPSMYMHGSRQASFDLYSIERLGALKIDLLGLDTVTLLGKLERMTNEWPSESYNDESTWNLIGSGDCGGVFQLEARGGQEIAVQVNPRSIEELAVVISLNRPAPLQLGLDKKYAERSDYVIKNTVVGRYLADTRGVPVYQDQVWAICREVAGMAPNRVDRVMKAIKGDVVGDELKALRKEFVVGVGDKMSPRKAGTMFDKIARYGFNKAHATAYAIMTYQTAWFKVHFPVHFCLAHMQVKGDSNQRYRYERLAVQMGVPLLNPHVNGSADYTLTEIDGERAIRRGYMQVKGVGPSAAEKIAAGAPYNGVTDFEERCEVNVGVTKVLRASGALSWDEDEQYKMAMQYMKWLRSKR